MMLLKQGLLLLWGQLTLLLKQKRVSCAVLPPDIRSVHRARCLLEVNSDAILGSDPWFS